MKTAPDGHQRQQHRHCSQHRRQQSGPPSCYSSALTCGVCLEELQDPRALPCLHTFCLDCLVRLHQQQRGTVGGAARLICPCCRRVCQTPSAGPEALPKNFHVARLREMRPLMQMGQGLAEEFSDRAGRELARLPTEAQLHADVADCRRRLAELRASQQGIAEFLDSVEEAVRDERESIGDALAEAKARIKEKRRVTKDCLARRSVSERLLDSAKSDRHQLLLELIGEFRDKCANTNKIGSPSSSSEVSTADCWTPTEDQVRRRLRARLLQLAPPPASRRRQCSRKRRKQQAKRKLQCANLATSSSSSSNKSTIKRRKRGTTAESTGSSSSRLLDESEIEELCREYGLAGYVFYED